MAEVIYAIHTFPPEWPHLTNSENCGK